MTLSLASCAGYRAMPDAACQGVVMASFALNTALWAWSAVRVTQKSVLKGRSAILLIGGDKTRNARFYKQYVPAADRLYDEHLEELRREGLIR